MVEELPIQRNYTIRTYNITFEEIEKIFNLKGKIRILEKGPFENLNIETIEKK